MTEGAGPPERGVVVRFRRWYGLWLLGLAWLIAAYPLVPGTPPVVDVALLVSAVGLALQALRSVVRPRVAVVVDDGGVTLGARRFPWESVTGLDVRPALLGRRLRLRTARRPPRRDVVEPWVAGGIDAVVEAARAPGRAVPVAHLPATPARRARAVLMALLVVAGLGVAVWVLRSLSVPGAWVEGPGEPVEVRERLQGVGAGGAGEAADVLALTTRDQPAPPLLVVRSLLDDALRLRWRSPVGRALAAPGAGRDRRMGTDAAVVAALRCAGRSDAVGGGGVEVGAVTVGSAAARLVEEGQRIVAVDDTPVRSKEDVYAAVEGREEGERVTVELGDGGERRVARLPVAAVEGTTVLADVEVRRRPLDLGRLEPPLTVDLDDVEGDSAGLAVALAVVDVVRRPRLAASRRVAVTGSVSPEGVVGPVGEVRAKVAGARRAAAQVLLVPSAQLALARRHAGHELPVVGVRTLDEGLEALDAPGCAGSG